MKRYIRILSILTVLICSISIKALAQDDDGGIGGDVPIDGGLSLLVVAGVGYGAKKLKNRRKLLKN